MKKRDIFTKNLLESGYGDKEKLPDILKKLTEEEIEVLSYTCYRACEKVGVDAFECEYLVGDDEDMEDK